METKADWLRSEIEKLEGMKEGTGIGAVPTTDEYANGWNDCRKRAFEVNNQALTSIITRYKEELKVLTRE